MLGANRFRKAKISYFTGEKDTINEDLIYALLH